MPLKFSLSAIAAAALTGAALGGSVSFSVPDFSVTSGTPYVHNQTVSAGASFHGLRLQADWSPGAGDPWSNELQLTVTSPSVTSFSWDPVGGAANANPMTIDRTRYLMFPGGTSSDGVWQLSFDTSYGGSTANMANVSIDLFSVAVTSYAASTTGAPQWDRPVGTGPGISGLGPVGYHTQAFTVDTTGTYDFFSDQTYDGFLDLYGGGFNPADPIPHLMAASDDGRGGVGTSDIVGASLTAGTTYWLVTSGFDAAEEGDFTNYIGGVGNVTLVPEPASLALLTLAGLLLARRR